MNGIWYLSLLTIGVGYIAGKGGVAFINRVWSASTDGYVDEVNLYLGRALDQFPEAHEHFTRSS